MIASFYFSALCMAPVLAEWALTADELKDARGGIKRDGFSIVSQGNKVVPLIDGKSYFQELYSTLESTNHGDFIHAVAFDFNASAELLPDSDASDHGASTSLINVLVRALKRGVHVRLLVNINMYMPQALSFCHTINKHCGWIYGCCVPETRHNGAGGSLHAKYWVIQRTDESRSETVAFVGGMDTTGGRYDTNLHNDDAERQITTSWVSPFWGWHDNMFQIRGPAVVDVAHHFWALWTDPVRSMLLYPTDKFPWVPPPTATGLGSAQVQTLVTASCKSAVDTGVYSLFAERGETSVFSAFTKLAANAKSYLYLEDQFMFFPEALAAVAAALPRLKAVVILTDPANVFAAKFMGMDFNLGYDLRRSLQYEAMKLLKADKTQAHKVHIFTLRRPGADAYHMTKKDVIYVHSKNYIADDDYAIVGSAGVERTGFTNDLDFAIGVQGDGFAASLRRRIWAEHLQIEPNDTRLDDPIAAISLWEEQAGTDESRILRYFPDGPVEPYKMLSFAEGIYEPDGRCGTMTRPGTEQLADARTIVV